MRQRLIVPALATLMLSCALHAQQTPRGPWEQTYFSLGFSTYSGTSSSTSVQLQGNSTIQNARRETELSLNVNLNKSEGRKVSNSETLDTSLRYLLSPRSRTYALGHAWYEHDQIQGIDYRTTGGIGLGVHVRDNAKVRLTIEGGVGATVERKDDARTFATLFINPQYRWNINPKTQFVSKLALKMNPAEHDDVRLNSETDLNFQLTQRFGIQNSVTINYDSQPLPGYARTVIQTSINFSVSVYKQ